MDGGLGAADFMDTAVAVGGNKVATGDPETAANEGADSVAIPA
jgi:hypothetical protein